MVDEKQTMRFNKQELELIKNTFAGNDNLLRAIQKVFVQVGLNAVELSLLETNLKTKEIKKLFRKIFKPELTDEVPYKQAFDLWLTIDLKNKMTDDAVLLIKSNKVFIDYWEQQIKVIEKAEWSKEQKIKFSELADIDEKLPNDIFIDIMARNTIFATLMGRLSQIEVLAGIKEETPEEQAKRLEKDSNR